MQRKLITILASVILLIALVSIGRRLRPTMPQVDRTRFVGLGQVLADETVKAMAGHGRVVVVINAAHQLASNPAHAELENFQSGLKKHESVSLAATEVVPADPDEMVIGNSCSGAQLQAILLKHENADAIIFLIGLPEWGIVQARGLAPQPGKAKIIVALTGAVPTKSEYAGYFANGFLAVLIGGRRAPTQVAHPKTPREWFDQYYQVYTPQNFATLPE